MSDKPVGIWVGASYALGRDVLVEDDYPHVCGVRVTGVMTGARYRLGWRDCAACGDRSGPRRRQVPETPPEAAEIDARRLGEGQEQHQMDGDPS